MEELFRFIMTRPAQKASAETPSVIVTASADYLGQLRAAKPQGLEAVRSVALAFASGPNVVHSTTDTKFGDAAGKFALAIDKVEKPTPDTLQKLVKAQFGKMPNDLIADNDFRRDREKLGDAVITNVILGDDRTLPTETAAGILRSFAIVARIAASDDTLCSKTAIDTALQGTMVLPGDLFPLTRGIPQPPPPPTEASSSKGALDALVAKRDALVGTYESLTRVTRAQLVEKPSGVVEATRISSPGTPGVAGASNAAQSGSKATADKDFSSESSTHSLTLRADAIASLPGAQRTVLSERGLDLTTMSLPHAVESLSREIGEVVSRISEIETPVRMAVRLGRNLVELSASPLAIAADQSVPTTFGNVAPAGIGDLLVVRQFLKRYEAQELGHVENILKGEFKERMHRRARTTEETITVETETKREEERDLQSTERFELKSEASETLNEDQSLKIGLAVSGSYGPMVEFKASTDFAMNHAKEESTKVATSYSKDVTQRATSKIFERRLEQRILKTVEQFEEKNTHGIDNKSGNGNVVGQYQWIDKVYEAQVYNYGKRLMFDIMLPEPAAFLLQAMMAQPKPGVNLVKPQPFTVKPTDIDEWNYAGYVRQYEVVGVTPPPQPFLVVAKSVEGKGAQDEGATKTLEIPVPDGYEAFTRQWESRYNFWDDGALDVVIIPDPLDPTPGAATLAVKSRKIEVFTVSVAIFCRRTQRALDDWKLKTHAAILTGYQKLLRDYEDKLAAAEVQAAQQVQGRNPLENELLIRTELKKGAISVFTAQHYDLFGAIASSPQGYPQPNLQEAALEGKYIRFFEQAFEWEQMMFFFYPYFWGRKSNWTQRALLQDTDPLFAEFIKAGSARIVVSVRPGFEQALAHFLESGETWNGGDLPPISSPLYFSIIEEIKERDNATGTELAQGDPWDVRLPTSLVVLRSAPGLPQWQKNNAGDWVPV